MHDQDTKIRLRLTVALAVVASPAPPLDGARPVRPDADRAGLARLMLDAYRGTVDDEGGTEAGALAEVDALLAGVYGPFDGDASELVERDGIPVAATLVTTWGGGPFVAFSMTRPAWQRRGLARAGLLRAMARLAARGETRLDLVVTAANEPATRLYHSLDFVERA